MTKRTVSARLVCRGGVGTALLMGAVLGAGEARANYSIKATEASQSTFVEDSKCNLVEAIDSVNKGKTGNGPGLHGCTNVGGGKKIVLEGTGAHYNLGTTGVSISVAGVEITSNFANKDFIEGASDQRVIMVLSGAGLTLTGVTIQRTGSAIAQVLNNQGTLTVNNCVVQNGNTQGQGGGIYNNGDLHVSGSTVKNNHAGTNGGGIFTTSTIRMYVSSSTVSGNTSGLSGAGIYGNVSPMSLIQSTISGNKSSSHAGGIYNNDGDLYMDRVTLQSNTALKNAGGIYNYLGTLTMTGGTLTGTHTARDGAGIYNNGGTMLLTNATVEGASASGNGGGIYNLDGTVTLSGSFVQTSSAAGDGGAIFHTGSPEFHFTNSTVRTSKAGGNGGGIYSMGSLGIFFEGTTISSNTASLAGGGIYSSSRCLGHNSTVSGNVATGNGGGIYSTQGDNEYLELFWVTIGYNKGADGGGVFLTHANTRTQSSIVDKNTLTNGTPQDYHGNPHAQDGDLDPAYRCVFGTFAGIFPDTQHPNDILGGSNILPLALNGGLTKTHELPVGSSAINKAGANPTCAVMNNQGPVDQRGLPRPVGSCDIGAYERQ